MPTRQILGRIRSHNSQKIVGAGFLVTEDKLLTCAHVVRDALHLSATPLHPPQMNPEQPEIDIDFPFMQSPQRQSLLEEIIFWSPGDPHTGLDTAALQLSAPISSDYDFPIITMTLDTARESVCKVYGFPKGKYNKPGVWAEARIKEQRTDHTIQLEVQRLTGIPIIGGFSGSPVWDENFTKIMGIILTADEKGRLAFMMPLQTIHKAWPEFALETTPSFRRKFSSRIEVIRVCLQKSYGGNTGELRALCQEHFEAVFYELDERDRLNDIIRRLITHCKNHRKFEDLWNILKEKRNGQYQEYYPHWKVLSE